MLPYRGNNSVVKIFVKASRAKFAFASSTKGVLTEIQFLFSEKFLDNENLDPSKITHYTEQFENYTLYWTLRKLHTILDPSKTTHYTEPFENYTLSWTLRKLHTILDPSKKNYTLYWTLQKLHTILDPLKNTHYTEPFEKKITHYTRPFENYWTLRKLHTIW